MLERLIIRNYERMRGNGRKRKMMINELYVK